ncbi:MAG: pyruvate dehydrogenase complex E1 component subunit beta [Candidatus Nealsonbacteria bacterium]|nr:pyruvate dehydrogenase complex E1 component subunit beta [Candidatus Nealsonbacteria bacterium]
MRIIKYNEAINEALSQMLEKDKDVFVIGQGVKSVWYAGGTCKDLIKKFGEERVIDTPVSENGVTGAAVGAAISGMRPIIMHPRMDFALYAMDPIINQAANWNYMTAGKENCPIVFWLIINRGGEQAAQHSQALQAIFSHIPGLKVVVPSNPKDAKGMMISSVYDNNPVVFVDDRWLYNMKADVPEEFYKIEIGKAEIRKQGKDITIISYSYILNKCLEAAEDLKKEGIDAEVIDLKTIKPLDKEAIFESVKKTGKVLIVDATWKSFGVSAEISALISEQPIRLKAPIKRLCLPDCPAPANSDLENAYYISKEDIIKSVKEMIQ